MGGEQRFLFATSLFVFYCFRRELGIAGPSDCQKSHVNSTRSSERISGSFRDVRLGFRLHALTFPAPLGKLRLRAGIFSPARSLFGSRTLGSVDREIALASTRDPGKKYVYTLLAKASLRSNMKLSAAAMRLDRNLSQRRYPNSHLFPPSALKESITIGNTVDG